MSAQRKTSAAPARINRQRRGFIRSVAMLPMSTLATRIGGVSLLGAGTAAAAECDAGPRSLVCLFLAGGADSFNMFVPTDQRYIEYRETRKDLAVAETDLIGVTLQPSQSPNGEFAFHRNLAAMAGLFDAGKLAVVSNVGPLIRPTTPADYAISRTLPDSLFAHDAQQRLWQTAARKVSGSGFGWGGAITEQLATCNSAATIDGAFSTAGANAWQNNLASRYVSLNPNARIERMFGLDPAIAAWIPQASRTGTAALLEQLLQSSMSSQQPLMLREAAASISNANIATRELETALNNNLLDEWVPDEANRLEAQLHLVTRLISARAELNMSRQVFFVQLGGWDTHSDQNERLPLLMSALDRAIGPYQSALEARGLADTVTSFTASDFGRTLTSNGNGTDHGWGGHNFVFGGAVRGGQVFGDIPSFASISNPDDAGADGQFAGRIIPSLSVNQYGATLSRWMGVTEAGVNSIFPDLGNFNLQDIGFLS